MHCSGSYQTHHHVHWADFDRVDSVNKLLDLVEGGSMGGVMSPTAPNQLHRQMGPEVEAEGREVSCEVG